ncbi:MAG TPA: hypothetical protein VGK19_17320 [Capsulimonadaceae bacterium]|jgi:hypothetical protein
MSDDLMELGSDNVLLHHAGRDMYFFAALTNAISNAYDIRGQVLVPHESGELAPLTGPFLTLVDAVFSNPHPLCLVWANYASQVYEGLTDHEEQWEWPPEMFPYQISSWLDDEVVHLKPPREGECIIPSSGPSGVRHSFRAPVGTVPHGWSQGNKVRFVSDGRLICRLDMFAAILFVEIARALQQVTQTRDPLVEFAGDEAVLDPHNFVTLVERVMMEGPDYCFEWARIATALVNGILKVERPWLAHVTNFPFHLWRSTRGHAPMPSIVLDCEGSIDYNPDPWKPPYYAPTDWRPVPPKLRT